VIAIKGKSNANPEIRERLQRSIGISFRYLFLLVGALRDESCLNLVRVAKNYRYETTVVNAVKPELETLVQPSVKIAVTYGPRAFCLKSRRRVVATLGVANAFRI
jgi:hypothetical protein